MTPFGEKVRELRRKKGVSLKEMASALQISSAYLSALEHGKRGRPTPVLLHQICGYFNIIWDEAEELAQLADISHPKITIDTSGLSPKATELANLLSRHIRDLDEEKLNQLLSHIREN